MKKIFTVFIIASFSVLLFAGCTNKDKIKIGDMVSILYTATFPDGKVFDENTEQTPLMFTVGSQQVIEGLDKAVVGMKVGKTKTVSISPEKGYGKLYDENKIQKVSQLIFDKLSIQAKDGTLQTLGNIEGIIKGTEQDENGNTLVFFDINPRQTRDSLQYKITILAKGE